MKTGIELIADERGEHFTKHGRTIEGDYYDNDSEELRMAAAALIGNEMKDGIYLGKFPTVWDQEICRHMAEKSYKERLIIAGALIAAEIDRLQYIESNE